MSIILLSLTSTSSSSSPPSLINDHQNREYNVYPHHCVSILSEYHPHQQHPPNVAPVSSINVMCWYLSHRIQPQDITTTYHLAPTLALKYMILLSCLVPAHLCQIFDAPNWNYLAHFRVNLSCLDLNFLKSFVWELQVNPCEQLRHQLTTVVKLLWYIWMYLGEVRHAAALPRVETPTGPLRRITQWRRGSSEAGDGARSNLYQVRGSGGCAMVWFRCSWRSKSGRWNKENMETSTRVRGLPFNELGFGADAIRVSGNREEKSWPRIKCNPESNAQQQAEMQLPNRRITLQPAPQCWTGQNYICRADSCVVKKPSSFWWKKAVSYIQLQLLSGEE